jgi:hypothetical protein
VWTSSFPVYSTWPASSGISVGVSYFPNRGWGWGGGWRRGWGGGWRRW